MEKEYEILNSISKNANITQRELSEKTGVSLGNVNILLKRLIKMGLLKAERFNSRTVSYILTPSGFKAIAKRTYDFITNSYRKIKIINRKIQDMTLQHKEQGIKHFMLYGKKDEFYELIANSLREINQPYELIDEARLSDFEITGSNLVYTWDNENTEMLLVKNIKCVNLLVILQD